MAEINYKPCDATSDSDFVGIEKENGEIVIRFPYGFRHAGSTLVEREDLIKDISILVRVVRDDKQKGTFEGQEQDQNNFPLPAYKEVMDYYISHNCTFYHENEVCYEKHDSGKVSWSKTFKKSNPIYLNKKIYYPTTIRKRNYTNEDNILTRINKYCVYEANDLLKFMTTNKYPTLDSSQRQHLITGHTFNDLISILCDKLNSTNKDATRKLFVAMIEILTYRGKRKGELNFKYGLSKFHYKWESLISTVFNSPGEPAIKQFYGKALWTLQDDNDNFNGLKDLRPDARYIAESENNGGKRDLYLLDAKYYRYGINQDNTSKAELLPSTRDINKQFTYEDIVQSKFKDDYTIKPSIFLIPFKREDENQNFKYIGYATCPWIKDRKVYAILVDTKYVIECSAHSLHRNEQIALMDFIETI